MKTRIYKVIMGFAVLGLVGCKSGSDDNKSKSAAIPAVPETIYVTQNGIQDPNNYCVISGAASGQRSIVCSTSQGANAQACSGPIIQFDDANLCSTLRQAQQQNSLQAQQCGLQAMNYFYSQRCLTNGIPNQNNQLPGQPISTLPTQPLNPNEKMIQCEFNASRRVYSRWGGYSDLTTGQMTAAIPINPNYRQVFNLREKFLGFDLGAFGITKMIFSPAGLRGSADMITIANSGLNKAVSASQSGFAGEEVRLSVQNDEGTMRLMVTCKGVSEFKKNLSTKTYTRFSCKGESDLGSGLEKIDLSLPYNTELLKSEITLAHNLTLNVSGDSSGQDNARISITAENTESNLTIQASAYLKTNSQIKINDGYSSVDVSCSPF